MYIAEAAFRAEEEGYDAVIMDTVSDSGLYAMRSRLNILAIGPGLISYAVATMLGKKFSIVTMWDKWRHLYEKNLDTYHLREKCASIRAVNMPPAVEAPFAGGRGALRREGGGDVREADRRGAEGDRRGRRRRHPARLDDDAPGRRLHERPPALPRHQPGPRGDQDRRDARPARAQALEGGLPRPAADPGREVLLPYRRRRDTEARAE